MLPAYRTIALRCCAAFLCGMSLMACHVESGDPLTIDNLRIRAPIPGSTASVAYFTINNRGTTDVVIGAITSPQYAKTEIHRTVLNDGVMQMRRIAELVVPAGGSLELAPSGYHLMLFGPQTELENNLPVSLLIHYGDNRELGVSAKLGEGFE